MDELNPNPNDRLLSFSSVEEQSSFVLQSFVSSNQSEELQYQLEASSCISQIYEEEFFDHFHINYYGELEHDGLFLASIRSIPIKINEIDKKSLVSSLKINNEEDNQLVRALIRTKNNNYDVSEIINIKNEENILQILFTKAQLSPIRHCEITHHIKANEKILTFDKYNDNHYSNKVSIIFQRLNQTNENEILSNNQISNEMENFLNLISERIQLKEFNKYRCDLDIKTNQHGIYSYYTKFQNHQIMFNIAPIIPSDENDQQFIKRKSLIANALLCIVFQEEETLFQPSFIPGKVTQVYITVQPIKINSELYYKVEIWRRSDIEPIIPSKGIFKHDESFRNYFLTLLLNTINIISKKDFFNSRFIQQRQRVKHDLIKKLSQLFGSYSKYRNYSDYDNDNQNLNITKQISSQNSQFSPVPQIVETFTDNQSALSSQSTFESQPSSVLCQQEDLKQPTDAISSWIRNINNFIELHNEMLSSTSTINNNHEKK